MKRLAGDTASAEGATAKAKPVIAINLEPGKQRLPNGERSWVSNFDQFFVGLSIKL